VIRPLIEEAYASWTAAPAVNSGYMLAGPCAHRISRWKYYIVIGSGVDEEITVEVGLVKKSARKWKRDC